nr:hypothetical protein [uncultured Tyzzerella sp.]
MELIEENKLLYNIIKNLYLENIELILPLLVNCSSDYICYAKNINGDEYIISIFHDDTDFYIMHNSVEKFFITLCAFYEKEIYFIDEDGYLDYDMDKEIEIGKKYNKNLLYWSI